LALSQPAPAHTRRPLGQTQRERRMDGVLSNKHPFEASNKHPFGASNKHPFGLSLSKSLPAHTTRTLRQAQGERRMDGVLSNKHPFEASNKHPFGPSNKHPFGLSSAKSLPAHIRRTHRQ